MEAIKFNNALLPNATIFDDMHAAVAVSVCFEFGMNNTLTIIIIQHIIIQYFSAIFIIWPGVPGLI